jgi:hypothetical protein
MSLCLCLCFVLFWGHTSCALVFVVFHHCVFVVFHHCLDLNLVYCIDTLNRCGIARLSQLEL